MRLHFLQKTGQFYLSPAIVNGLPKAVLTKLLGWNTFKDVADDMLREAGFVI